MADTDENSSAQSTPEIRIVGLNTDKTWRTLVSTTVYQVYFELSERLQGRGEISLDGNGRI